MRRESLSALIAATAVIGLPTANAVAAITASPPGSSSAKAAAVKSAAVKAAAAKAARARVDTARAAAAKAAAAPRPAPVATRTTVTTITTETGVITLGPPLDLMPTTTVPRPAAPAGEHTFVGDPVEMDQWGPVTVTIVVENGKIIDASADMPMERARSNFINSRVQPYLNAQTLKIQSAKLDLIAGATRASFAYAGSLQSALDKAGIKP